MERVLTSHVGETNIANNGLKMTIIAYRENSDIDIRFEEGTIVKHKRYSAFKKREIAHPNITRFDAQKAQHIGEKNRANNGLEMTIIAYRNNNDIDVRFETGGVREHADYKSFKRGTIALKHKFMGKKEGRLGEIVTAKNGLKMTIVAYRGSKDVDVQFEDGTIVTNKDYGNFKKGTVLHPTITCYDSQKAQHIGEKNRANNGLEMTIIAYRGSRSVDVQFETGETRKNINYGSFCKGSVALNTRPDKQSHIGETIRANNGLKMTIVEYYDAHNVTVQFETGEVRNRIAYHAFSKGQVKCDKYCNGFRIDKVAYEYNGTNNFYCYCEKCGKADIMTVEEIKQHKCESVSTPLT